MRLFTFCKGLGSLHFFICYFDSFKNRHWNLWHVVDSKELWNIKIWEINISANDIHIANASLLSNSDYYCIYIPNDIILMVYHGAYIFINNRHNVAGRWTCFRDKIFEVMRLPHFNMIYVALLKSFGGKKIFIAKTVRKVINETMNFNGSQAVRICMKTSRRFNMEVSRTQIKCFCIQKSMIKEIEKLK